jgi:hypothetical protein
MQLNIASKVLACFGLLLLGLNIAGLFIPLRNPDIYRDNLSFFKDDITLTEGQLWSSTVRQPGESTEAYVTRLNDAVNKGIAHYWDDQGIHKYNLRIPIYENYLLFFASYLYPSAYRKYEYCDYKKAIKRGLGLCSEHAIVLTGILKDRGIESQIVSLSGHVVAMAQVNQGTWWVLDSDFGVVIPHSIAQIESDPNMIRPILKQKGYSDTVVNWMVDVYGKEGNQVFSGASEYRPRGYQIERLSYILIWILPAIMMVPFFLIRRKINLHRPVILPTQQK